MLIGPELLAVLPELRAHAESRMDSICDLRTTSSEPGTDPDGFEEPEWVDLYADRACRLGSDVNTSRDVSVGDIDVPVATRVLHLAHDTRIPDGTIAHIKAGEWAGLFVQVVEATGADQKTALRLRVLEVPRPDWWI